MSLMKGFAAVSPISEKFTTFGEVVSAIEDLASLPTGFLESAILLVSVVEGNKDGEEEVGCVSVTVEGVWLVVSPDDNRDGKGRGRKGGERGETASGKPREEERDSGLESREEL